MGLLAIGSVIRREFPSIEVQLIDSGLTGHEKALNALDGDVVGLQASSTMVYRNTLELAARANERGAIVVVGGAFATTTARQIMEHRPEIDCVVEGPGETPMLSVCRAVRKGGGLPDAGGVEGLWLRRGGTVVSPPPPAAHDFEESLPFDYTLIDVAAYHRNFRRTLHGSFDACFQIFTHFGCRYRDQRRRAGRKWCSYCALGDVGRVRHPDSVRREIRQTLSDNGVPRGSRVMLKCYGDNASALGPHLQDLAEALSPDPVLRKYDLAWSMYAQSTWINPDLMEVLRRLGVAELYVGFDSADDAIQKENWLGTKRYVHLRAAELIRDAGMSLQAGFVLGCAGETTESLANTKQFAKRLHAMGNLTLVHASPLAVLPGAPAFEMLAEQHPELLETDMFSGQELQRLWLANFCPGLGPAADAAKLLDATASELTGLGRINSSWGGWEERVARDRNSRSVKTLQRPS